MNRLIEAILMAKTEGSYLKFLNQHEKVSLIILDDFGLQTLSKNIKLALLKLIEDHYAKKSLIITSQLPVSSWYDYLCLFRSNWASDFGLCWASHLTRQTMNTIFQKYILTNLTASIPGCVDHIAISNEFIKGKKVTIDTWNEDKKLSDHKGTSITLTDQQNRSSS